MALSPHFVNSAVAMHYFMVHILIPVLHVAVFGNSFLLFGWGHGNLWQMNPCTVTGFDTLVSDLTVLNCLVV